MKVTTEETDVLIRVGLAFGSYLELTPRERMLFRTLARGYYKNSVDWLKEGGNKKDESDDESNYGGTS